jgi:hypothetical protein
MVKILLWLCFFIGVMIIWKVGFKIYLHQYYQRHKIQQSASLIPSVSFDHPDQQFILETRINEVEAYEQQLFDDICQIFFEQKNKQRDFDQAVGMQEQILRKMPAKTQTQIRRLDLDEWSIYWAFFDQSLEYYVGRYGVFYTHVDRFGLEHKFEIKEKYSQV